MTANAEHHELQWSDGQPFSRRFGDVYFSRGGGLDETHHVFIQGNRLAERFASLTDSHFTIAELGFGTGLNFLCAWRTFREHAPSHARLHFVSFERYPLLRTELQLALSGFPVLNREAQALLVRYEQLPPGWHRIEFDAARVALTLVIGDANTEVSHMTSCADAWFLDGFSPAKNPDLWTPALFGRVSSHSKKGTTFATYSAAGHVRRALQDAGFRVVRAPGFGDKREMSLGVCEHPAPLPYRAPWATQPRFSSSPRSAIVVGGGLAGTACAHRLAARGIRVTLLERHDALAGEASGNAQAILYIKPSPHGTRLTDLVISGYGYVRRALADLSMGSDAWSQCGVLQLAFDDAEKKRQEQWQALSPPEGWGRRVSNAEAVGLAGVRVQGEALWYSSGGWVHPAALCAAYVKHDVVRVQTGVSVGELKTGANHRWRVAGEAGGEWEADMVVLATANGVNRFPEAQCLPLKPIRGQITQLPSSEASNALRTVLCGEGYVAPARLGVHCLGATFDVNNASIDLTARDHIENLVTLKSLSNDLFECFGGANIAAASLSGRAAVRSVTPDYLPIVGPLMQAEAFNRRFARLAHDATAAFEGVAAPWENHLYVSTGHGSRGLITASLAAETIAAIATGEPVPVSAPVAASILPGRFLARALARRTPKRASRMRET